MEKQPVPKVYAQLIKFGRLLKSEKTLDDMANERPDLILSFVWSVEHQLMFTKVEDFFSIFPPIKRYEEDGTWNYRSTLEMAKERLGTHFGKDDFKHLLMTHCYENKWLRQIGVGFMMSISRAHKNRTGRSMLVDFLENRENQ